MDERNLNDLINCDNAEKEKMVEEAKEKLRWYTFEASDEEFDVEAVDALVRFLREIEPEAGMDLAQENDKTACVQKRRLIELNRGKIVAAVGMCVLLLTLASVIMGNSLRTSLAWEEGGFFKGLRKDKDGQTMITSPDDLGMENGMLYKYSCVEDVPKQYQELLIDIEKETLLKEFYLEGYYVYETPFSTRISMAVASKEELVMELGVMVYKDQVFLIRDSYDDLEFQYTKEFENYIQEVYIKKNADQSNEYFIFVLVDNKRYFASGEMEIEELEAIVKSYVKYFE